MSKLWSGRFSKNTDKLMEVFNASIDFDKRLYREDIEGSLAHAAMLKKIGVLSEKELSDIQRALHQIESEIEKEKFQFHVADEDIHMAIEKRLTQIIGQAGKRLHTARSRNDQVATDVRLYFKRSVEAQVLMIKECLETLLSLSKEHVETILPGMTHFQPAQPITLGYYFMAYFQMFSRDLTRFQDCLERGDVSPLGSGAFSGVNYPVDRHFTQEQLGFASISVNSMDAVSDRDFILEYLSASAIMGTHLSRLAEELIIWSNPSLGFVQMDDRFATGSSIMPNKKNPDAMELIRGKTGRFNGNLMALLTVMKALPLAYNKDMQEDKEGFFDTVDHMNLCLSILPEILKSMKVDKEKMLSACEQGYLQATDVADYLVGKGMPFREAHEVSGKIVGELSRLGKTYSELSIEDYQQFSALFEEDIFEKIKMVNMIQNKVSMGSTSFASVHKQMEEAKQFLTKIASIA